MRAVLGQAANCSSAAGDSEKQVHLEGYQVSGQCQALVRDGILLPTRDAPELGYIRDCSAHHYVPDVYYKVPAALLSDSLTTSVYYRTPTSDRQPATGKHILISKFSSKWKRTLRQFPQKSSKVVVDI